MNPIGCNSDQLKDIMLFCGYKFINLNDNKKLYYFEKKIKKTVKKINKTSKISVSQNSRKMKKKADPNSPFAVLEKLL